MIAEFTIWHFVEGAACLLGTAAFGLFVIIPWTNRIIEDRVTSEEFHNTLHDGLHEDELYEHFHDYSQDNEPLIEDEFWEEKEKKTRPFYLTKEDENE